MNRFRRRISVVLPFVLAFFAPFASAADFAGGNVGLIPDNNPAGLDIAFAASGITTPLADVSVSLTLTHEYLRDLQIELVAPSGAARRMVVGRVGYGAVGGSSDFTAPTGSAIVSSRTSGSP